MMNMICEFNKYFMLLSILQLNASEIFTFKQKFAVKKKLTTDGQPWFCDPDQTHSFHNFHSHNIYIAIYMKMEQPAASHVCWPGIEFYVLKKFTLCSYKSVPLYAVVSCHHVGRVFHSLQMRRQLYDTLS